MTNSETNAGIIAARGVTERRSGGQERHGGVAERAGRFRPGPALQQQITALEQPCPADDPMPEFRRGARAVLRWLLAGGPAPLTETVTEQPPPPAAVVRELTAAEALIYQRRSSRREYGRGVQHALMWAQYATATPPSPTPPSPTPPSATRPSPGPPDR